MYPATLFNWHDLSEIGAKTTSDAIDNSPLLMQVFSADKGTEDLIEIKGKDFDAMYGTMSFTRHGQSAIQAKAIIDAGGKLYAKRVVAPDSKLANLVLVANIIEENGNAKVKWTSQSITNCKTFDDVKKAAAELYDDAAGVYPLFVYSDNGRGKSSKAVRLTPDYPTSKTIGTTFYTLSVFEGVANTEKVSITVDPTLVYSNVAYRLDETTCTQIKGEVIEDIFDLYAAKLADLLQLPVETVRKYDIVYGYTNRGASLPGFVVDSTGVDLDAEVGLPLAEGDNGVFGDAPVGTAAWTQAIYDVFAGQFSDDIYDVDKHKIAVICDANYPQKVKEAIFALVTFREDCVYLRDMGLDLTTFLEIKSRYDVFDEDIKVNGQEYFGQHNYFVADYCTSYQVKDPSTRRNIKVTCMYDMAPLMVNHIVNNAYAALAGTSNGFVLSNAIKGTLNYTPVHTPVVNQKEAMENIRVNYAVFEDDNLVMQSSYSSQLPYTQLSYVNNVIGIQKVMRALRTECPKQRYTLTTGSDLSDYATAVNKVLANFTNNFAILNFIYTEDKLKTQQKIFYASIEFAFLNWAQTEIFDIYAINAD